MSIQPYEEGRYPVVEFDIQRTPSFAKKTRYYLDTEFIDDGSTIDLISIGIVCEDGREYYQQSSEFNRDNASPWVKENILPHLWNAYSSRESIRQQIEWFLYPEKHGVPEFHGWCSGYDWVAFCQLWGTMMQLPEEYPHYIRDLQQELDAHGISDEELPPQERDLHNALADARHIRHLWGVTCGHYADKLDAPILPPYAS